MSLSSSPARTFYPWQAEPYRLWSLLDMLTEFGFTRIGSELINFERACAFSELVLNPPEGLSRGVLLRRAIPQYATAVDGILKSLEASEVSLAPAVRLQLQRLQLRLRDPQRNDDYASIVAECRVARQAVLDDLSNQLFLTVEANMREHYEQKAELFGAAVQKAFPDASRDIAAAGRCLALREGTATVFHLMRVLEHGLRMMAMRFTVPFSVDSWHKVIRGIEDGITDLRNKRGLTDRDRDEITYYSDAASQFRHFKDAWRNHVSHAREFYGPDEAAKVMRHVREFMQHLAEPI